MSSSVSSSASFVYPYILLYSIWIDVYNICVWTGILKTPPLLVSSISGFMVTLFVLLFGSIRDIPRKSKSFLLLWKISSLVLAFSLTRGKINIVPDCIGILIYLLFIDMHGYTIFDIYTVVLRSIYIREV